MHISESFTIFKSAAVKWSEDKAMQLGAALAFYSILSIGPLLIIAIAFAALVFGRDAASGQIVAEIQGFVGKQAAEAIQTMLANSHRSDSGVVASLVGIATLLIGASGVFGQLQDALNVIWRVKPEPRGAILAFLRQRFLSFAMVVSIGFLLLISLLISAGLAAFGKYFVGLLPSLAPLLEAVNFLATFGIATVLFALIFKVLPDTTVAWRNVWTGAALTALLFAVGKVLIGLYLGKASLGSAYGAAGSLVVLSLWIYYSALILFLGAEVTYEYAEYRLSLAKKNMLPAFNPDTRRVG